MEVHLTEYRLAETEVAETDGQIAARIQLRDKPDGVARGGELDDGFHIDGASLLIEGGALAKGRKANEQTIPSATLGANYSYMHTSRRMRAVDRIRTYMDRAPLAAG